MLQSNTFRAVFPLAFLKGLGVIFSSVPLNNGRKAGGELNQTSLSHKDKRPKIPRSVPPPRHRECPLAGCRGKGCGNHRLRSVLKVTTWLSQRLKASTGADKLFLTEAWCAVSRSDGVVTSSIIWRCRRGRGASNFLIIAVLWFQEVSTAWTP